MSQISCPICQRILIVPEGAAGSVGRCPCGQRLKIPGGKTVLAKFYWSGQPTQLHGATTPPVAEIARAPVAQIATFPVAQLAEGWLRRLWSFVLYGRGA